MSVVFQWRLKWRTFQPPGTIRFESIMRMPSAGASTTHPTRPPSRPRLRRTEDPTGQHRQDATPDRGPGERGTPLRHEQPDIQGKNEHDESGRVVMRPAGDPSSAGAHDWLSPRHLNP
ncbi:hypothetical protein [Kibdelosporangium philippinense]|uniref:hypothetical protein n=1 Tax=Kibdelosporangium philippinense TaxID=211113 RepID=UPI003613A3BF